MNVYVKSYFLRGALFSGLGPIVFGIVLFVLDLTGVEIAMSGRDVLCGVVSTHLLAFVQAGSSVFNQIEHWSVAKGMGIHFASLYLAYVGCYLANRWIPFDWRMIAIFTAIFAIGYLAIWLAVYITVRLTSRKLNRYIG
ncbi:MAG: DUF3021 domain-containing protein [Clostridia bacterium]|nr:DUF3021 domain-containing protein [Clostridia bacterium]